MPKIESVIVSGGGTGGHIFPALAVAQEIQARYPEADITFVGAEGKMEMEKVPQFGFEIVGLPIRGLQRKFSLENLKLPFKLIASLRKAKRLIKQKSPQFAIGFGGYAAGPALWAAKQQGIPIFLQEQNAFAGITNKILSKHAKAIFTAYQDVHQYFSTAECILTGNPVRKEIANFSQSEELKQQAIQAFNLFEEKPTILITGGSLGARVLNACASLLIERNFQSEYNLIWQCGKAYYQQHEQHISDLREKGIWIHAFIERIDLAYQAADLVIARAGALTVSELACTEIPTIFIPSPYVAEDHQNKNAHAVEKVGAAFVLKEEVAEENILRMVHELFSKPEKLSRMANHWKQLQYKHAAKEIVNQIEARLS